MAASERALVKYRRGELEAMPLAKRIALEDAIEDALPVLRELNDAEIRRLHEAKVGQRGIAEAMGVGRTTARRRLARLGLAADVPRDEVGPGTHPPPQNGDGGDDAIADGDLLDEPPKRRPGQRFEPQQIPVPAAKPGDKVRYIGGRKPADFTSELYRWFGQGRYVARQVEAGAEIPPDILDDLAAMGVLVDHLIREVHR